MTSNPQTTILVAILLTLALLGTAVAPAGASHESDGETDLDETLSTDDDSRVAAAIGFGKGLAARAGHGVSNLVGDSASADENADDAVQAFNKHNETLVAYANDRNLSQGEVVEIEFVRNGETATAYIVATYNSTTGEYDSARAVRETDRTVDHQLRLEGIAADQADEEIERFATQFAEPNKDVTREYLAEMSSKYGGNVDEPFTGE